MKVITITTLTVLLAIFANAQDSNPYSNWVNFETPNLSVSMPKDYLVNVEKIQDEEKKTIYSFANGVMMEFSYYRVQDAKSNLTRVYVDTAKKPVVMNFTIKKLVGKQIAYSDNGYRYQLFLASSDRYYQFEISTASKEKEEVALFLHSIKINGKRLIKSDKKLDGPLTETISTKSLKSSEQVIEALKRKSGKHTGTVTYEPLAAFKECKEDFNLRAPILLTSITLTAVSPDFSTGFNIDKGGEVKIKLRLLADGQVGDIVIYSDADRRLLKTYAESARKAKFIPAESNQIPIDACKVVWWTFSQKTWVTRQTTVVN